MRRRADDAAPAPACTSTAQPAAGVADGRPTSDDARRADDDEPTTEPRRRADDEVAAASPSRCHGCPVVRVARPAGRPRRRASSYVDVVTALRDDGVHDVRRRHRASTTSPTPAGRCPTASTPSASRSSSTSCRTRATAAHPRARAGARRRPDGAVAVRRCTPAPRPWSARSFDMFGIALRRPPRPHPHPHARRLGSATRCARTTPSARIPVQFKGDPTATTSDMTVARAAPT